MPEPDVISPRPRVLVTRAPDQASDLADHLRALGVHPVLIPAIELVPPTSWITLDTALDALGSFHWLLFTSANAAEAFASRREANKSRVPHLRTASPSSGGVPQPTSRDNRNLQPQKIAAIGPATAKALEKQGLTPDLLPPQAVAESLAEALLPHVRQRDGSPTRFLLIRAEEAREHLPDTLRDTGAEVTVAPAYRTVIPESSIHLIRKLLQTQTQWPAAITFTSSSTARNLLALCEVAGVTLPKDALRISIGPITTRTLVELGLPPHAEAAEASIPALARAAIQALNRNGGHTSSLIHG